MMKLLKKSIKKIIFKFVAPQTLPNSYSQAGEDMILNFLFRDYGKSNISYLDLGTNVPDWSNNTYIFYRNGNRGVCVEADANLIKNIKLKRPKDTVLNVGVSISEEKEAIFYVFDTPSISTFDREEALYRESFGNYKIVNEVKVPLININNLISDNFEKYPDLISIDIENLDFDVLKSIDYHKYPIPVICVETCKYSENHIRPKDYRFKELMLNNGYEVYADTYINTIFVNKEWFCKEE
jgi:FkbM family methyltransferase